MNAGRDIPAPLQITTTPCDVNKFVVLTADPTEGTLAARYQRALHEQRAAAEAAIAAQRAAAELARQHAAERARAAVIRALAQPDLDRLDTLPELHAAALLRSTGLQERSVDALRERLAAEQNPEQLAKLRQTIATAVQQLDAITPPDSECDPLGRKLVRGREDEIRAEAENWAQHWAEAYKYAAEHGHPHDDDAATIAEKSCPRWWRRQLRRSALRAQAYYDCALRIARPGEQYVSSYTLAAWRERQERSKSWAAGIDVRWDDGSSAPLSDIINNAQRSKRAQLYAVVKAMEYEARQRDYTALFITLTLPPEFHSVSAGAKDADGKYHPRDVEEWTPAHGPRAQIAELNRRWALIRARLAKHRDLRDYFGILVPEPHQDGTPHMHAMLWLPTRYVQRDGTPRLTAWRVREILKTVAPGRQSKLDIIRKRPGKKSASAASYVMKYVMKSLNSVPDDIDSAAPDDEEHLIGEGNERFRAWASARGIRRMRLLGVHGSLRIWQRLWTSSDDEQLPARAERVRAAMRAGQAAGEQAEQATDPDEIARWREQQAASFAAALTEMAERTSELEARRREAKQLNQPPPQRHRLALQYKESETEYGRPSKRPDKIIDTETGAAFPLRLRKATLVPSDEQQQPANDNPALAGAVTVDPIYPRGAPAARSAAADQADELAIIDIRAAIQARQHDPRWREWCDARRKQLESLERKAA